MVIGVGCALFWIRVGALLLLYSQLAEARSLIERQLIGDDEHRHPGAINIDCGLTGDSYSDASNGMTYTSDDNYISTGKNYPVSAMYTTSDVNWKSLMTVRSFSEGSRNCYGLSPVKPNNKYLIRARFMYGDYDHQNSIPQFDIYIDVNLWFTFKLSTVGDRLINEIIHVATTESIFVCLVNTGQGTPFISALELRPMDNSSYPPASPGLSLTLWDREDIGGVDANIGRYSVLDDRYDRLWLQDPTWFYWEKLINTDKSIDASQDNPNNVPNSVLKTAGLYNGYANFKTPYTEDLSTTQVYAYWYFAELVGPNETREFTIDVAHGPGYTYTLGPISPKYLQPTTIASPRMFLSERGGFEFNFSKTRKSNLDPIVNAVEIYEVLELPASPTNQEDADAILAIKNMYAVLKFWQGDPCLPANHQWDGLNCTYDNDANTPSRITSLSLSSKNLTGELPPSLSKLMVLNYLNLSNNGFTGKIPGFLAYLPSLKVIDLTRNKLMGPIPPRLAEKASNKSIDLRVEGNPDVCKSYSCEVNKKRDNFIIPVVTSVASVSLLVIICIIFLAFKRRKKQGLVDGVIKPKNKQFNSSEIVRITDNFGKVLGKGGFGTVYYGVLQDDTEVAVKVLNNTSSTITMRQFCAEAELLMRIHHVNLVSLIGYCDGREDMALVYEYMSCGDLQTHLSVRNENPLSWKARLHISIHAAQGLEYLHSGCQPPIIHRDIKPANILLDEMGHAKIADFGLSRFFTTDSQGGVVWTTLAGTRGYLDPEYSQLMQLSEKSDVYAFGIVLLQLLTGKPALIEHTNHEDGPIETIVKWVSPKVEKGDILAIVDKRLKGDIIVNSAWKFLEISMECVKQNGNERPRMSEVVADLKVCYTSAGFHEQDDLANDHKGNCDNTDSSQAFNSSFLSLPSAR